ncbi:MAG: CCA tRNA nucleotidyltransferase [Candidatus Diapherotrites archaeon]|nr:CCA tRNA nucleotidyltransferase [Candidatus Diapherotrites archaeon]
MNALEKKVISKIKPSPNELQQELEIASKVMAEIKKMKGPHVNVLLCGSLARNTHVRKDRDIDIFVQYPKELTRVEFEKEGLKLGKAVFKNHTWKQQFAEHPYIRGNIQGYEIEIVPSYKVEKADQLQSAVDRSPFHQAWLEKKLTEEMKDQVRLLKSFLKGINCYGAKIKVSSMPGYVVELLIVQYGSFEKCLKAVSIWKKETIIDLEKQYETETDTRKKFQHHLIVVDPTDKNRNVASALSYNQFARFIAAARAYLKKPSLDFFFENKKHSWPLNKIKKYSAEKNLIVLTMPYTSDMVSDIVHGQLRRFSKKLKIQLELNGFNVDRLDDWSDEKQCMAIIIDMHSKTIDQVKNHFGPEVTDKENSEKFLKAHKKSLAGPRIEEGRWVIEKLRKFYQVEKLIVHACKNNIEKQPLKKALKKSELLNEKKILALCKKNSEFKKYFTQFLKGKEEFLDY